MVKLIFSLSSLSFFGYVIGFVNQIIIANKFGTSAELDIYLLALSVVNFGWFFAGPLTESGIPILYKSFRKNKVSSIFFSQQINNFILLSLIFSFLIFIFSYVYLYISDEVHIKKIYLNIVLLLPVILFTSLSTYLTVVLNSKKSYLGQSLGKLLSAIFIMSVLFLYSEQFGIKVLIFSAIMTQVIILLIQVFFLSKTNINYLFYCGFYTNSKYLKMSLILGITYAMSSGFVIFERWSYTSFGEGVLSSFNYAYVLFMAPVGVVLTPLLSVYWTEIMEKINNDGVAKAVSWLNTLVIKFSFFSIVLSLVLYILADKIVEFIYNHGRFSFESLENTSMIFSALVLAMPQYVALQFYIRLFTSLRKKNYLFLLGIFLVVVPLLIITLGLIYNNINFILYSTAINYMINLLIAIVLMKKLTKQMSG